MDGWHAFTTQFKYPNGIQDLWIRDFEALTWAVSALAWKKYNGRIGICTNTRGKEFIERSGLVQFYDEVKCVLDDLPVPGSAFFAAAKPFAIRHLTAPFAIFDTDFISWIKLPESTADITGFFWESYYGNVVKKYTKYGFTRDEILMGHVNAAIVVHRNEAFKSCFSEYFEKTANLIKDEPWTQCGTYMYGSDHCVFAEQYGLSICAQRFPATIDCITRRSFDETHHEHKDYLHLWNSKAHYDRNPNARKAFVLWMRGIIDNQFPEASAWAETCKEPEGIPVFKDSERRTVRLELDGQCMIYDANVPIARLGVNGETLGPGEAIKMCSGSCKLIAR